MASAQANVEPTIELVQDAKADELAQHVELLWVADEHRGQGYGKGAKRMWYMKRLIDRVA